MKETRKVKISAIGGGIGALERLVERRMATWAKTREIAKYYGEVIEEVKAYNAELQKLAAEFPDGGDEYAKRLSALVGGEVELSVPTLGEEDFASAADMPTPSDMYLLRDMIDFE